MKNSRIAVLRSRRVAVLTAFVALLCISSQISPSAFGSWNILNIHHVSSIDFLPSGTGLVGFGAGSPHLEKWDASGEVGVLAGSGTISSIAIVDSTTAMATIANDGLYISTNHWNVNTWKKVADGTALILVFASKGLTLLNNGRSLQYSVDRSSFFPTSGIASADSITQVDWVGGSTFVAAAVRYVYRSTNGGINWSRVDSSNNVLTVYADTTTGEIFEGGDSLRHSIDSGRTWKGLHNDVYSLSGQIVGAHDCTGTFYITSSFNRSECLRTTTHGVYFQDVGPANLSSVTFAAGRVFDRGSTFYWLDKSGVLSGSFDGVDSSILQGIGAFVSIASDSPVVNNICSKIPTDFYIHLGSRECPDIIVDSLIVANSTGKFVNKSGKLLFSNAQPGLLHVAYTATTPGKEIAQLRLTFHSTITGAIETKDFTVDAEGTSDPARISVEDSVLAFGEVKEGSSKSLLFALWNSGCSKLEVDSLVSSDPSLFVVESHSFPVTLSSGDSLKIKIRFAPADAGDFLEALELGTSAGHKFYVLRGTGTETQSHAKALGLSTVAIESFPNPARQFVTVRSSNPLGVVLVRDLLGRVRIYEPVPNKSTTATVAVSKLSPGCYWIEAGHGGARAPLLIVR